MLTEDKMMTGLHETEVDGAPAEPGLRPLVVVAEWAALVAAGFVAIVRFFAGKDQAVEIIQAPPEAEPRDFDGDETFEDVEGVE